MVIIIQDRESKASFNNNNAFVVLNKICDIKTYRNIPYIIMLVNIEVDDEGVVEDFNFPFEELIVTLNIIAVITNSPSDKLREICYHYKISLLEANY